MADPNTVAQYIWRRSRELGVNPNMALGIAKFEGLNPNTLGSATYGNPDAAGYSFGPFQLYSGSRDPSKIAPGGLAFEFKEKYGVAPSKDNWQQQVDFSLETMKSRGVTPWHAVRDQGGIDAITQKGARYATQLGLADDQSSATPVAAAVPTAAPQAKPAAPPAPVYSQDLGTMFRLAGNAVAPGLIDAPTPLTADQIAAQPAASAGAVPGSQLAGAMSGVSKGLLGLAALAKEEEEKPVLMAPPPPIRQAQFVPLKKMRGLL